MKLKSSLFFVYILSLSIFFIIGSCKTGPKNNGKLIASVYNHKLYQSEIISVLGIEQSEKEPVREKFIDSWIKKKLIISESSLHQKDFLEIDQLVLNYKNNLILQKSKDDYLDKNFDVKVSETKLIETYEMMKNDFLLDSRIFKVEILTTSADHPDKLDVINYFKQKNYNEWKNSIADNIVVHLQDTSKWMKWNSLSQYIPYELLKEEDIKANSNYFRKDDKHLFFIRIFEVVDKNEIAPLSYMRTNLEQGLLQKRKETVLKEYESSLYSKALKKNQIKIN